MKKLGFILLCFILTILPCLANTESEQDLNKNAPKIFVYHIPEEQSADNLNEELKEETQIIISDDITADTSIKNISDSTNDTILEEENYSLDDMYTDVLHGYASYDEDEANTIVLEDYLEEYQTLNIKRPYYMVGGKYIANKHSKSRPKAYSKLNKMEYTIEQKKSGVTEYFGNFSTGTAFEQKIDYAELRQVSSIYSRYDAKYYALTTEFSKTVNSTNGDFNDYFSFSPELKLSQYISLKETLSANFAKHTKIAEFVISINPFGNRDKDRFRLEVGTSSVFDQNNSVVKNRLKINTKWQL
ncbi:MAG: hypothetical protein E7Z87_02020 [Cyanobacteria bacterium SIG26]|nr:hypothetical protein [Cyanobacteria bacterium SIG26]